MKMKGSHSRRVLEVLSFLLSRNLASIKKNKIVNSHGLGVRRSIAMDKRAKTVSPATIAGSFENCRIRLISVIPIPKAIITVKIMIPYSPKN